MARYSATRRVSPSSWRSQVAAVWCSVCAVTCFSIPARVAARRMIWENTPWKLAAIDAGDWLVKLLVIGLIVSAWQ
jgi:Protein of unknown function (DUF1761)